MTDAWTRIEQRLDALGCAGAMALRPGASDAALDALEQHVGARLPAPVRACLARHDGQDGFCVLMGYGALAADGIGRAWSQWRSLDALNADFADTMASDPPGVVKPLYSAPGWIPLAEDGGGNYVGVDLDPDVRGRAGQIIAFGRDEDTKRLLAPDVDAFLGLCADWLDRAVWTGEHLDAPP